MQLTIQHRRQFTAWFCVLFYVLAVYKWWHGMWLMQLKPHLFNTRFDMTTWLFMKTGIHTWLLDNPAGWLLFDTLFFAMPLVYWLVYQRSEKLAVWIAAAMMVINWIYLQCYTLFPANSMESYTAWLLFPLLFMTTSLRSFYYLLHGLRYFFIFFFFSAGVWKLMQAGAFNVREMSGVLLYQHKEYLASSPSGWISNMLYWLIDHPFISYGLYLSATVIELLFVVGFFTKKFDRLLLLSFMAFLLMDVLIMRIPYWEVLPYVLVVVYSKYAAPDKER